MPKKKRKKKPTGQSQRQPRQAATTKEVGPSKKRLFWLVLLALPVLLVLTLEGLLSLMDYGAQLSLTTLRQEDGEQWLEINQDVGRRYFGQNPSFARQTESAALALVKPSDGYRIICLGGSTMAGFPYNQNATMPGILRTYLQKLYPTRPIEVINLGIAAVNSYAVRDLMQDVIALDPDAIVIYTGHNEFYGALGVGSSFFYGGSRTLVNLYLRLLRTRTFFLLQQSILKLRMWFDPPETDDSEKGVMQRMARQQHIPYQGEIFRRAETIFTRNIEDVIDLAATAGIPLFIGNLVSNLRDQAPFISVTSDSLTPIQKAQWQANFNTGKSDFEQGGYDGAKTNFQRAFRIDSSSAALNFHLAHSYLATEGSTRALGLFRRARDLDALRFRAPSSFNAIIRDLCDDRGAVLVDIDADFAGQSRNGVIGSELITEHLHPNATGYALMARSFLAALAQHKGLPEAVKDRDIMRLPLAADSLGITDLDLEIGRQRIAGLTSQWPFKQRIELATTTDPRSEILIRDIAGRYVARELSWVDAHLELAEGLEKIKAFDLALVEYLALLQVHPDEGSIYERVAECYLSLTDHSRAMMNFSRAAELDPTSPYAFAGIGKVAMFQSQFEPARLSFAKAIDLDNGRRVFSNRYRSFIVYLWGGALTNLGQYARAKSKFEEAIDLDASNNLARSFLETLKQKMRESGQP